MNKIAEYESFEVTARPQLLKDGRWTTEVHIRRNNVVRPYFASNTWETEDAAIKGCFEFGRRIIDGEIPALSPGHLP